MKTKTLTDEQRRWLNQFVNENMPKAVDTPSLADAIVPTVAHRLDLGEDDKVEVWWEDGGCWLRFTRNALSAYGGYQTGYGKVIEKAKPPAKPMGTGAGIAWGAGIIAAAILIAALIFSSQPAHAWGVAIPDGGCTTIEIDGEEITVCDHRHRRMF